MKSQKKKSRTISETHLEGFDALMSVVSSSTNSTVNSTMALTNSDFFPRCEPDMPDFKVKDYFLDLESYFVAFKIENANQKRSFLQLSLNKKTKFTLSDVFYPEEFSGQGYDAVKNKMLSHYADKKMLLVYRERFNQRIQQDGETCKEYFGSLRSLARMCDYTADFYKQQMHV